MRAIIIAILISLSLAGCLDDGDSADDDTDPDNGDDGDDGTGGTGGDDNETEERETVQITVTWEGAYAGPATETGGASYDKGTLTVPANSTVELTFVNDDPASAHDIAVDGFEDAGGDSDTIDAGAETTITFDVDGPMETTFYCTIPGHRDNGMEGTFIVE